MKLPSTTERVSSHSSESSNLRIQKEMERRLSYYLDHPQEIAGRLHDLNREWDIERTLETNASVLALLGVSLTATVDRKFLVVPAIVTGFLLQHALQGWCPPVPILRRLGVRTQSEIELERYALKALRGDFVHVCQPEQAQDRQDRVPTVLHALVQ
ncbi:hypothetical protein M1B72_09075 [Geomonas paludis]|uniref:DUF2892 domain-containing protein n=1 Tax=Geomonas paludis TaxID=2740185 RepID=A0ABY4LL19_9BACT|nr:hypothetical protein [Geomonas paludis]UPU37841.1 hypothetical protein M1B72_09075 [Geomonas paludis]